MGTNYPYWIRCGTCKVGKPKETVKKIFSFYKCLKCLKK